ncbi:hypothetical protein PAPHI01_1308 [Pancytospora philotis]|nr:hypothetical protein PAPHI01_1308 [Pancytospora philotis]
MSSAEQTKEDASRNGFFHSSVNISIWMKERITEVLAGRGCTPIKLEVTAEVMSRMSKMAVINNVDAQYRDCSGKLYELNNYSSISKSYECPRSDRWFVDAVKELEMEAMLKFGGKTLGTKPAEHSPKLIGADAAQQENTDDLRLTLLFCTTLAELRAFLTERDFIYRWSLGRASFEADAVRFEAMELRDIKADGSTVQMTLKREDWASACDVRIELLQIAENVRLTLLQRGVPLESIGPMKRFWNERVFMVIAQMFGCPIKQA